MGKFSLPRKISNRTIIKLFLLLVFVLSGYYFFPYLNLNSNSEKKEENVLQAVTGTAVPVYKVDSYVMKDVIRPDCDKDQPYMDFFCRKTEVITSGVKSTKISRAATFGVNNPGVFSNYLANKTSTSSTIDAGIEYYANPVLEEIDGVPVLAYYGGLYEIALNQNPQRVVNITRPFRTAGKVGYTAGCFNSWFPSNLGKKGNTLVFGSGGLESYVQNRCYNQQKITNGFDTGWGTAVRGDRDCAPMALELGIPTIAGCKPDADTSCWKKEYQCKTLNGFSMYYNIPFISRLTFSKTTSDAEGSVLRVSAQGGMRVVPSSGGAATPDAYSFCRGKTKNDCTEMVVELAYGDKQVLRCGAEGCNDYGTYDPPQYGMPVTLGGSVKTFYKRIYSRSGFNKAFQDSNELKFIYGGYDTPLSAFSAKNRVDLFHVDAPFWRGGTNFRKYRLTGSLNDGMLASPAPYKLGLDWVRGETLDVKTGAIQDYVSDKYFFSLQYINNSLVFSRFMVTGFCGSWGHLRSKDIPRPNPCPIPDITTYNRIVLPGVNLSYIRNVTFSINSAEDIDIMIAPNFKDTIVNPNAKTRMFRAQNFNSPTGSYRLYELTPLNGGYQFLDPDPGNNQPLTFRYYNNTDTDTTNDYAVFVSKNYVFSSKIPPSPPDCTPNYLLPGGGLSLTNINANSNNNGIKPNNYDDPTTANLNYSFNQPLTLKCPSGDVNIPAGTSMTLSIYDGITKELVDSFDSPLLSDRKSIKYTNLGLSNFSKYFYQLTFDYQDNTYNFPLQIDTNRYFTLESYLNLYNYIDDADLTTNKLPRLTITKNLKTTQLGQYNISAPQSDLTLYNNFISTFFFDHNLSQAGNVLTDSYNYKICSSDGKITKIGFHDDPDTTSPTSLTNESLTASISNDCVNVNYRSTDKTFYSMVPQSLDLYVRILTAPPSQNLVNFRVNGNVMVKNSLDLQYYSNSNTKLKGVVVSNIATGTKVYNASANFGNYFKIPYVSDLKSGINLAYTEDFDPLNTSFPDSGLQNYYLLSSKSPQISSSLKTIDVFASLASPQVPTIIYVARDKALLFDLNDTNLALLQGFDKVYFVSADPVTPQNRIIFKVNCGDINNYREICINNSSINLKGGIYGNMKTVFSHNTQTQNRSFINIIQNPELMLDLQIQLKTNKIYNVTRSKTVFKYLNN